MDDLRLAWITEPGLAPGTAPRPLVGMSLTPGHPTRSSVGMSVPRDLDTDLVRISIDTSLVVVLLTNEELAAAGIEHIVERGLRYGVTVVRRPVISGRPVPTWLMREVASLRHRGPALYVDTSGRGRAAVAVAWALVADGASVPSAIESVREVRGQRAITSKADHDRVDDFWRYQQGQEHGNDWSFNLPTSSLRRSHLPPPRAPWLSNLNDFALTFDGYKFAGGMEELVALSDHHTKVFRDSGRVSSAMTLDIARACIFRVQRAWRNQVQEWAPGHYPGPHADALFFVWALIEWMRDHVTRP